MLVRIDPAQAELSVRTFECFNCDNVAVIAATNRNSLWERGRRSSTDLQRVWNWMWNQFRWFLAHIPSEKTNRRRRVFISQASARKQFRINHPGETQTGPRSTQTANITQSFQFGASESQKSRNTTLR